MKTYSKMIDDYIRGTLSQSDNSNFEKALANDPRLQLKVKFCRELHESSNESDINALRATLSIAHSTSILAHNRFRKILYASAAACFAIIIAISITLISRIPKHEELFANHFNPYQLIGETRSGGEDSNNSLSAIANSYYDKKHYDTTITELTNHLQSDPDDIQARLLLASVYLEANYALLAQAILEDLLVDNIEVHYKEISRWYLALSILKQGNVDEVKPILAEIENENGFYSAKARSILNSL